jgi:hypothetical protein
MFLLKVSINLGLLQDGRSGPPEWWETLQSLKMILIIVSVQGNYPNLDT